MLYFTHNIYVFFIYENIKKIYLLIFSVVPCPLTMQDNLLYAELLKRRCMYPEEAYLKRYVIKA